MKKAHERSHHRFARQRRHSLRDGFTVSFVLFLVSRAFLPPSPARCASIVTDLTPASGRQNHTTSPSAASSLVSWRPRVHRIPHPTFVTIGQTPLWSAARRAGL